MRVDGDHGVRVVGLYAVVELLLEVAQGVHTGAAQADGDDRAVVLLGLLDAIDDAAARSQK